MGRSQLDNFSITQGRTLSPLKVQRNSPGGPDFLIPGGARTEGGPTLARGHAEKSKHQKGTNLIKGPGSYSSSEPPLSQEMESHSVRCLRRLCVGFCIGSHVMAVLPSGCRFCRMAGQEKSTAAAAPPSPQHPRWDVLGQGSTEGIRQSYLLKRLVMEIQPRSVAGL